jgi:NitT/TauT family transport system permease protein
VAFGALLLALWEVSVIVLQVPSIILPKLSSVVEVMVTEAPMYLSHMLATASEVVIGFVAATIAGAALGTIIASSKLLGNAIYPALISMQVMPKVAVAPILIIWFGFGILPKVVLTALIAFFPIVINTIVGLRMTSKESIFLFRSMGATRTHTFFLLRLPSALPVFFGGLKISSTLATIGAVVGEFSGAEKGLGYLLTVQVGQSETAAAFGSVLYLTLLGLLVFAIVAAIENLVVPSHMLRKMGDVAG